MDSIRTYLLSGLAAIAIACLGWWAYRSQVKAAAAADWVGHTHEVIAEIQSLRSLAKEIESAQRAYIITGDANHIGDFEERIVRLDDLVASVSKLVADNPEQHRRVSGLKDFVAKRIDLLRRVIELRKTGGFEKAREQVASNASNAEMARILDDMVAEERTLLVRRQSENRAGSARVVRTFAILAAAGAGLYVVFVLASIRAIRRHRALEEERDRYFNLSPDMLCVAGTDGYLKRVNPAFESLGWSVEELTSRAFLDFVHADDVASTLSEMERLRQGIPTVHFENRYRRKDGTYRWMNWSCRPVHGVLYAAAQDVTERKRLEEELRALSLVDDFTGLANRRGFVMVASQQLRAAARAKQPAVVVFVDLDGLKAINDKQGHEAGDRAIKAMADVLRGTFRDSDIVARLGGDEFVALIADCADPSAPLRRMQELLKVTSLSASVGWTAFDPEHPDPVDVLLQRADEAMYQEKQKHKRARTARR